jgi:hypothetical protein
MVAAGFTPGGLHGNCARSWQRHRGSASRGLLAQPIEIHGSGRRELAGPVKRNR